jgi:hypothetical protein
MRLSPLSTTAPLGSGVVSCSTTTLSALVEQLVNFEQMSEEWNCGRERNSRTARISGSSKFAPKCGSILQKRRQLFEPKEQKKPIIQFRIFYDIYCIDIKQSSRGDGYSYAYQRWLKRAPAGPA